MDFLDFKKVAFMLKKGNHLQEISVKKIISIKDRMNNKRPYEERWNYFFSKKKQIILNKEWVQAFIDGEGSFQFNIVNTFNRKKPYIAYISTLSISQSSHSVKLLKAIIDFFGFGYLKPKYDISDIKQAKFSHSVNRCIINNTQAIINFVDKYPMLTRKHLDYLDWKRLIKLKDEKAYNSITGKILMEKIKSSMNSGRK